MPIVPVNYLAILVAALAGMFVGFVWYGPIFGKMWMSLTGMTQAKMEEMKKKGMTKNYLLMFIGMLLMSDVLAHFLIFAATYMNVSGVMAGLSAGFWSWLGFIAPVMLSKVLWEGKSWNLWLLDSGHYLVVLLVMGAILASWT